MNAHKVDYNMELYVPELLFYQQHNIFTNEETQKIVKIREQFEKKICESFCPLLSDFTGYLEHLQATKQLVEDRLRNQIIEGVNKESLNPSFSIINQQIHRTANQMLLLHTENKKTYIWLFRYAIQSGQESLGLLVAKKLTQLYPGYFLGWVFLAKVLEVQYGTIEARRTYFLGLQNIRETCHNYSQYQIQPQLNNQLQATNKQTQEQNIYIKNNGKYAGDALEKDEIIRQQLPQDGFIILYNWYILELQLLLDMGYQQLPEQEFVFDAIQSKDQAIQLLVGGFYLVLIIIKAIEMISKFTTQTDTQQIFSQDPYFKQFINTISDIHNSEQFIHKITFSIDDIINRAKFMILDDQTQTDKQNIQLNNFNTLDQLLASDE